MSTPRSIRQARRLGSVPWHALPCPSDADPGADDGDEDEAPDIGDEGTFAEPWEPGPCEWAADAAADRWDRERDARASK